jgi:phage shock protein PspC (stress-responsive transcriptional regulator)
MKPVITVSLAGNPYPLEDDAHARLRRYLEESSQTLAANPDRDEILTDLERSIAAGCQRRLPSGETVIPLAILEAVLLEIGPVRDPELAGPAAEPTPTTPATSVRFEQVSEGAWISGVCRGLGRALNVDVGLVRLIGVLLLFFTGGAMTGVYLALMLVMPYAPLGTSDGPVRALPRRCRNVVERLRAGLIAAFR